MTQNGSDEEYEGIGPQLRHSHELRIQRLEEERGGIAADISSLRTEMRTRFQTVDSWLERIESKIEERPSRSELVPFTAPRSIMPSLEADGKKLFLRVKGPAILIFWLALLIAIVSVIAWLLK